MKLCSPACGLLRRNLSIAEFQTGEAAQLSCMYMRFCISHATLCVSEGVSRCLDIAPRFLCHPKGFFLSPRRYRNWLYVALIGALWTSLYVPYVLAFQDSPGL